MNAFGLVDLSPLLPLLALAAVVALLPLGWVWLRARGTDPRRRLALLTAATLFLTFDLIVFGSFTRLTDSGLGCPDWPGCYGQASPIGARADIQAAQEAAPSGPVTHTKAWIEMIHRYLAMMVGALILVMCAAAWRARGAIAVSPWWPTLTLAWVLVQGGFGKFTVTLKLHPLVVTLHLLGGLLLLALLVVQHERWRGRRLALPASMRGLVLAAMVALGLQIALGGWVSSNYAVLACEGVPTCNGQWWPATDWPRAFQLLRPLGGDASPGSDAVMSFEALVTIHLAHRLGAVIATLALAALAWRLWRAQLATGHALALALLLVSQVASGLSNVVLGWPIVAALMHSAGAAGLVAVCTSLWARSRSDRRSVAPLPVARTA
jgi:cytochrome c oxidase assembly protein subunit 15